MQSGDTSYHTIIHRNQACRSQEMLLFEISEVMSQLMSQCRIQGSPEETSGKQAPPWERRYMLCPMSFIMALFLHFVALGYTLEVPP